MRIAIEKNQGSYPNISKNHNPKKRFFARLMYVLLYILLLLLFFFFKTKVSTEYDKQLRVCQGMQGKCANKANKSKRITDGESHQSKTAGPTFSYLKLNVQHVIPENDIGSMKCHPVYQCCGMCSILVCEEKHHQLIFISIHQRL